MSALILTLHILACLFLILLVLLQSGKEGMGVIFGGGSQSLFGSSGAGGLLVKLTAGVSAVFLVTSLTYNVVTGSKVESSSRILDVQVEDVQEGPLPGADQPLFETKVTPEMLEKGEVPLPDSVEVTPEGELATPEGEQTSEAGAAPAETAADAPAETPTEAAQ